MQVSAKNLESVSLQSVFINTFMEHILSWDEPETDIQAETNEKHFLLLYCRTSLSYVDRLG